MEVTVVVATYGDRAWLDLALERAVPSAVALGVPVVQVHGRTLHEARMRLLREPRPPRYHPYRHVARHLVTLPAAWVPYLPGV